MALYAEVSRKYRGRALLKVMQIAESNPHCEASREAGRITALLSVVKGADQ